jgi:Homeodomain-like domain
MAHAESRAHSGGPGRGTGDAGAMARDRGGPARVAERARIVLLAAGGLTGPQIAERVGCSEPTVIKWRRPYAEDGLAGLGTRRAPAARRPC